MDGLMMDFQLTIPAMARRAEALHPRRAAVLESAVIGLRHPKWDERPLALVVRRPDATCCGGDIVSHLSAGFPKFWLPSGVEFVESLPRTSVGKLNKLAMREAYRDYFVASESGSAAEVDGLAR